MLVFFISFNIISIRSNSTAVSTTHCHQQSVPCCFCRFHAYFYWFCLCIKYASLIGSFHFLFIVCVCVCLLWCSFLSVRQQNWVKFNRVAVLFSRLCGKNFVIKTSDLKGRVKCRLASFMPIAKFNANCWFLCWVKWQLLSFMLSKKFAHANSEK